MAYTIYHTEGFDWVNIGAALLVRSSLWNYRFSNNIGSPGRFGGKYGFGGDMRTNALAAFSNTIGFHVAFKTGAALAYIKVLDNTTGVQGQVRWNNTAARFELYR